MVRPSAPKSAIIFTLTLVCFGCSPKLNPGPVSTEATSTIDAPKQQVVAPRQSTNVADPSADSTLYPNDYEARGIPSIQNPWTIEDYRTALEALTVIGKENPEQLPRLASNHSGAVFRRMVSRENLLLYANTNIDLLIRSSSSMAIVETMTAMMGVYLQALLQGQRVDREVLEMYVQQGHALAMVWETVDDMMAGISSNDVRYTRFMTAVGKMQTGSADMIRGMLMAVSDRQVVSVVNLEWYVAELAAFMPNVIGRLNPSDQAELEQNIARLAATEREHTLAKHLETLQRAVSQSTQSQAP